MHNIAMQKIKNEEPDSLLILNDGRKKKMDDVAFAHIAISSSSTHGLYGFRQPHSIPFHRRWNPENKCSHAANDNMDSGARNVEKTTQN